MEALSEETNTQNPPRIGLTLSGGGFRATLFHLGVVRLLYETGLLRSVERIGAVSGGSILAAHLVLNWDRYTGDDPAFASAAREITAFVRSDVRGRVVRRWLLAWLTIMPRLLKPRHWTFTNLLQRFYARLYHNATLADLHPGQRGDRPQVFFYCTSLSTGGVCSFGRSGFMWDEGGDEHSIKAPATPVAFAVAASSAFPPLFPPIAVSNDVLSCDVREFSNPQYLTDGGVYDNLGIDRLIWYHKRSNDLDLFLVSDAEGNFDWDFGKSYNFITSRNVRASEVLMKRVSTLEYETLAPHRDQLIVLDIKQPVERPGDPTLLPPEIQRSLRNMRTDLDAFSPTEIECLIQHGFTVAREQLLQAGLAPGTTPGFSWEPLPDRATRRRSELRETRKSRDRRLRLWSFRDWASWTSLLVVASVAALLILPPYLRQRRLTEDKTVLTKQNQRLTRHVAQVSDLNRKLTTLAVEFYRERHRPVEPGVSASHRDAISGTICCVVKLRNGEPGRYLLGSDFFSPPGHQMGDLILQPGLSDGGRAPEDAVARLYRVIALDPTGINLALGAIAEVLPGVEVVPAISGFGRIRGTAEEVTLGQEVFIVGRTSGIAKAIVTTVSGSMNIAYVPPVRFDGLIGLKAQGYQRRPTGRGDSGAPVLTTDGRLVGMIFAGAGQEESFAVPIRPVLDALGAELYVGSDR